MPRWTPAEDAVLLAAKLTPHTERHQGPHPTESLQAVAARLGRSLSSCTSRRDRLERKAGQRGAWTKVGLWTPAEDDLVLAGGSPQGRTVGAMRTRRCNLNRKARTGG